MVVLRGLPEKLQPSEWFSGSGHHWGLDLREFSTCHDKIGIVVITEVSKVKID